MLWVGVVLVALAGLIFAFMAWPSLGDLGRFAVLIAVTMLVGGLSLGLRRRLPATSESMAVLFLVLLLIDWQVLRSAGVVGSSDEGLWWAAGLSIVGLVGAALGVVSGQQAPRVCAGMAFPLAAIMVVTSVAVTSFTANGRGDLAGFVLVTTIAVGVAAFGSRLDEWRTAAFASFIVVGPLWLVAFALAVSYNSTGSAGDAVRSALGAMSLAVPLAVARIGFTRLGRDRDLDAIVGCVMVLLVSWGIADLLAIGLEDRGVMVAVTLFGVVLLTGTRFVRLDRRPSEDVTSRAGGSRFTAGWWAGALTIVGLAGVAGLMVAVALVGYSLDFVDAVDNARWVSGSRLDLTVTDLAMPSDFRGAPEIPSADLRTVLVILGILLLATVLKAVDIGGHRRRLQPLVTVAIGCGLLAAFVVVALFAMPVTAAAAVVVSMVVVLLAAVVAAALGSNESAPDHLGTPMVILSGGLWFYGLIWALLSGWATVGTLVTGTVILGMIAITARTITARSGFLMATTVLAVASWWTFLAVMDVDVLEIYTLPAAMVVLGAGWTQRRTRVGGNSWIAYGPGLVLAGLPSLIEVLTGNSVIRVLALLVGMAVMIGVGVIRRLQAPVVIGIVILLVLAIDTLYPVAAQVPRWALIAAAGVAFIWMGATFERRLRDLRRIGAVLDKLH